MNDSKKYEDKVVVVTGGTRGIGLETALAFARAGARCYVTCYFGSADNQEILSRFDRESCHRPEIRMCNTSSEEETQTLLDEIKAKYDRIETWISNASVAQLIPDFASYQKKSLFQSIESSAWPLFDAIQRIKNTFGCYPRYVIGMSSAGAAQYLHNYDFMAASKNVLETLCRYANYQLREEDIRINIVRGGMVKSSSLSLTFGEQFEEIEKELYLEKLFLQPEEIASTVYGLCSGYMDAIRGEVINADKGLNFYDTFMRIYSEKLNTQKI